MKKLGVDNSTNLYNEFLSGILGFLSTIYIVPLTIALYRAAQIDNFPIFVTLVGSIFTANLLAAFIIKQPAIIGPSIAITVVITKTLIINLNYSIGNVTSVLAIATLLLLLLNIKHFGFKIIDKIPCYLKKYFGIAMGGYLMYIGFIQGEFLIIKNSELSLGFLTSKKVWLTLLGCIIIFFCYFTNNQYGALFSIIVLSIIIIFGIYLLDWNYPGFNKYHNIFASRFVNKSYFNDIGQGFLNPITYVFGLLIALLTVIGIPSMIHPISKSMGIKKNGQEKKYSSNLFRSISLASISNLTGGSGYPSLFAETMIVTHSKGKSGVSNLVLAIMFLFSILLYPVIPILSNKIITAPLLIFIGFITIKSSAKSIDHFKCNEFLIGLVIIITTLLTNSIPHGLTVGFVLNIVVNIKQKNQTYINMYTVILMLVMIFYEIMVLLVRTKTFG